jgi:tetratricopeptide (TPR) repeat protein
MSRPSVAGALSAAFVLLILNSAYLWARADPTIPYYLNVALHPLLGLALTALALWHSGAGWKATPLRVLTSVTLAATAALGIAVLVLGATRPYYSVVLAHVAIAVAGVAFLSLELWRSARAGQFVKKRAPVSMVIVFIAVCVAALTRATHDADRARDYRIVNPEIVPATMDQEGGGPRSPFFPSSAGTKGGEFIPSNFFLTSAACGRCHRDIYEQWNSSMHHFASFNNQWYRKSIEYMQDVVGTRPSKWCAGCHDHALLFSGRFDQPVTHQIATPEAQAGLSCTSCHAITQVRGTMGQGGFEIEYSPLHDLAASPNRLLRAAHDTLLDLAPRPHREAFLKPFHREQAAEFCSSCHKVHLDQPVNAYRWLRGFNDYDNWQASGVSGEGARSFYYPPQPQTCTDCHMPRVPANDPAAVDGTVRSHRFAAANTAVPFVNGDVTQLNAVRDFLQNGQVTIDVFGIVRSAAPLESAAAPPAGGDVQQATTFAVGEESFNTGGRSTALFPALSPAAEVLGPFGVTPVAVARGESVRLEVVVRTRKVGHFFPGGTVDAFDVWLDVEARDNTGRLLLHSGPLEASGAVEPGAHRYRSLLLDEQGNPINKRNAWAARSVAYVRLIPPGAADTIHYRLDIPEDAGETISITARLKYRKFAWWNTQWAYAGVRDPQQPSFALGPGHDDGAWVFTGDTSAVSGRLKAIPDPPIIEMAMSQATLSVLGKDVTPFEAHPAADERSRERWNDYGIGLLLQGDIRGAEAAFLRVTQIDRGYADGWVNIARARIQEGNMAGAEQILRNALTIDPDLAKTHFFLGTTLRALGRYDEALTHLRQAASQYPRDRVVLNQIGRVLFLKRQFAGAISEFRKVLSIDPEDVQAHYNLMLCYQGLGDVAGATRERVLYERFKADEASQAITGDYRRLNAHDNNERQPIHEHRTVSLR